MNTKRLCYAGLLIGSTIGGYVPALWGAELFSFSSLVGSLVGGLLGIWAGYRIGQSL